MARERNREMARERKREMASERKRGRERNEEEGANTYHSTKRNSPSCPELVDSLAAYPGGRYNRNPLNRV